MQNTFPISKEFQQVITARRSTRKFSRKSLSKESINEILSAALYAPYGGATGIPLNEIRKIFVFDPHSEKMDQARALLLKQIRKSSKNLTILLFLFPFLKKKMKPFSERLKFLSQNGISSLTRSTKLVACHN